MSYVMATHDLFSRRLSPCRSVGGYARITLEITDIFNDFVGGMLADDHGAMD